MGTCRGADGDIGDLQIQAGPTMKGKGEGFAFS